MQAAETNERQRVDEGATRPNMKDLYTGRALCIYPSVYGTGNEFIMERVCVEGIGGARESGQSVDHKYRGCGDTMSYGLKV